MERRLVAKVLPLLEGGECEHVVLSMAKVICCGEVINPFAKYLDRQESHYLSLLLTAGCLAEFIVQIR